MGRIHKTMTPAAEAANRANGAESNGPESDAGKGRSKMNAFKHGQYAARPDPVELLLAAPAPEEEAEREALRAEAVQRYQPSDAFARQAAEELADLRFELRRLGRVKEALWQRERELLGLEQRRRAQAVAERVQEFAGEVSHHQVNQTGVMQAPESPHKYRELLVALDWLKALMEGRRFREAWGTLAAIYGDLDPSWRGHKLMLLLHRAEKAAEEAEPSAEAKAQRGQQLECWLGMFRTILADELREVQAKLELCVEEQGPLTEAGQAMRLLEATSGRKWAWVRQQENFLRRSIDRRLRILMELRRDHAKAGRQLRELQPASGGDQPQPPDGGSGGGWPTSSGPPQVTEPAPASAGGDGTGTSSNQALGRAPEGSGFQSLRESARCGRERLCRLAVRKASGFPAGRQSLRSGFVPTAAGRKGAAFPHSQAAEPPPTEPSPTLFEPCRQARPSSQSACRRGSTLFRRARAEQGKARGEARRKNTSNRGTNPPCALESVNACKPKGVKRLNAKGQVERLKAEG